MNKAYLVPVILIVLLLVCAGVVVFTPSVSNPMSKTPTNPLILDNTHVASSTIIKTEEPSLDVEEDATTTIDEEETLLENATTSETI